MSGIMESQKVQLQSAEANYHQKSQIKIYLKKLNDRDRTAHGKTKQRKKGNLQFETLY